MEDLTPENRMFVRGYRLAIQHLSREIVAYSSGFESEPGGTMGKLYGEIFELSVISGWKDNKTARRCNEKSIHKSAENEDIP